MTSLRQRGFISFGRHTNSLLAIIALILVVHTLKAAASVFIPLVLAIFLVYLLAPIFVFLERLRIPYIAALPVIILGLLGVFLVLEVVLVGTIKELAAEAPRYEYRLTTLIRGLVERLGPHGQMIYQVEWLERMTSAASHLTVTVFGSAVRFVSNTFLVLLFTGFILAGRRGLARRLIQSYPGRRAAEIQEIFLKINLAVQRYIVTKVLVSLATGVSMYLILSFFGLDFALFWGFLGFIFNFIPAVGSIVACTFPITLALVQFEDPLAALWVALALLAVQVTFGNIVEPLAHGRRLNLSPMVILFALVLFGWMWGFWGMVVSVPITAVAKIAMEQTSSLKTISRLLESG